MKVETITSRTNALCTHIRKLASSAAYRRETGEFLCDSPKLLKEALLWKGEILCVVFTEGTELPALDEHVRLVKVSSELMESISPMRAPQGVLFTCRMPRQNLPETLEGSRYVVLDGVQDPGNVGTILRSLDVFDADGLVLLAGCADLYNPKTVRATMGALFRRNVWNCTAEELKETLKRSHIPLYGAALREDTVDARKVDYSRAAVAIDSEGRGLSDEMLALCDRTIRIPMSERCESLNAAIAASVLLWEMYR
ncbi:MAG: RNA methyltransferase [Oscillospiraceae bacterium]|nr:RNA methyltransferase [Oscillospiraceae bacterium]